MDTRLPPLCELFYDRKSVWVEKPPLRYRLPKLRPSATAPFDDDGCRNKNITYPVTLSAYQPYTTIGQRMPHMAFKSFKVPLQEKQSKRTSRDKRLPVPIEMPKFHPVYLHSLSVLPQIHQEKVLNPTTYAVCNVPYEGLSMGCTHTSETEFAIHYVMKQKTDVEPTHLKVEYMMDLSRRYTFPEQGTDDETLKWDTVYNKWIEYKRGESLTQYITFVDQKHLHSSDEKVMSSASSRRKLIPRISEIMVDTLSLLDVDIGTSSIVIPESVLAESSDVIWPPDGRGISMGLKATALSSLSSASRMATMASAPLDLTLRSDASLQPRRSSKDATLLSQATSGTIGTAGIRGGTFGILGTQGRRGTPSTIGTDDAAAAALSAKGELDAQLQGPHGVRGTPGPRGTLVSVRRTSDEGQAAVDSDERLLSKLREKDMAIWEEAMQRVRDVDVRDGVVEQRKGTKVSGVAAAEEQRKAKRGKRKRHGEYGQSIVSGKIIPRRTSRRREVKMRRGRRSPSPLSSALSSDVSSSSSVSSDRPPSTIADARRDSRRMQSIDTTKLAEGLLHLPKEDVARRRRALSAGESTSDFSELRSAARRRTSLRTSIPGRGTERKRRRSSKVGWMPGPGTSPHSVTRQALDEESMLTERREPPPLPTASDMWQRSANEELEERGMNRRAKLRLKTTRTGPRMHRVALEDSKRYTGVKLETQQTTEKDRKRAEEKEKGKHVDAVHRDPWMIRRTRQVLGPRVEVELTLPPILTNLNWLPKHIIFNKKSMDMYRSAFDAVDLQHKGRLNIGDVMLALRGVNRRMSHAHNTYILSIMEIAGIDVSNGIDFNMFAIIATLSERVAALDKLLMVKLENMDWCSLEIKMLLCKALWLCVAGEHTDRLSIEQLQVELRAGGISLEHEMEARDAFIEMTTPYFGLDFVTFLSYIPLFVLTHTSIVQQPLSLIRDK